MTTFLTIRGLGYAAVLALAILAAQVCSLAEAVDRSRPADVWVVFFASQDCPRCEAVKILIQRLKKRYPVRIKSFNIDDKRDYELFTKLEAIHGENKFGVPLVLVGESILMGEDKIAKGLENIVKDRVKSGGSPLPYLGPTAGVQPKSKQPIKGKPKAPPAQKEKAPSQDANDIKTSSDS